MAPAGPVRVGIGGWDYDGWRGSFYPPGLPRARQLEYAAARLTAIEINATYYKLQKPELFARWAAAVPDGFKFALKAGRYCTNRKILAEAGEAVARFCGQGLTELGDRLGPILWQFMATKRFDPDDFAAFLALLPHSEAGVALSHVVEVRHESFRDPAFLAMARTAGVGIAFVDDPESPAISDAGGGSVAYARLKNARPEKPAGYLPAALDRWARAARAWSAGCPPEGAPLLAEPPPPAPRDAYIFMIDGAKERAPAAALALISRL